MKKRYMESEVESDVKRGYMEPKIKIDLFNVGAVVTSSSSVYSLENIDDEINF